MEKPIYDYVSPPAQSYDLISETVTRKFNKIQTGKSADYRK